MWALAAQDNLAEAPVYGQLSECLRDQLGPPSPRHPLPVRVAGRDLTETRAAVRTVSRFRQHRRNVATTAPA
jgi:hypothetical protein